MEDQIKELQRNLRAAQAVASQQAQQIANLQFELAKSTGLVMEQSAEVASLKEQLEEAKKPAAPPRNKRAGK